jgi:hypothetical protein
MGILFYLGKENPAMMLAFVGVAAIYCLVVHILVLVAAFQEGAGTGFLALCLPFYAWYFVFKVSDNDTLKILYFSAIILNIVIRFL